MAKYIIELERGETAYKTVNSNGKPMIQLLAPTPYTEPDMEKVREAAYMAGLKDGQEVTIESQQNNAFNDGYKKCLKNFEQVRKEAYKNGYDAACKDIDIKSKTNAAYRKGLEDAWDAARKIIYMPEGDLLNIFTECYSAVCTALQVLLKYDAAEAIEKIRQYEQEKEAPKKEQSVTVEDVMRQYLDTFCKERSCSGCPLNTPDFTCGRGHHFLTTEPVSDEEVRRAYAKVLRKMKGE